MYISKLSISLYLINYIILTMICCQIFKTTKKTKQLRQQKNKPGYIEKQGILETSLENSPQKIDGFQTAFFSTKPAGGWSLGGRSQRSFGTFGGRL